MTDNSDDYSSKLRVIRENIERCLGEATTESGVPLPRDLAVFCLTLEEAEDWLNNEPRFTRRKVTPLRDRRQGTSPVLEKA
jgi:hypothetical protein